MLNFQWHEIMFAFQFMFMQMYSSHPKCISVITFFWYTLILGCTMYIINNKVHLFKLNIKMGTTKKFGSVDKSVKLAEESS